MNVIKKNYIKESLKTIGVKEVLFLSNKSFINCPNLYISTYAGPSDFHRKDLLIEIRDLLSHPLKNDSPQFKIFLSRAKATRRNLNHEIQVKSYLESQGFQTIYAEDLSFNEQVKLFSNTAHLVSLHGAGLSNILFMPKGSKVTEIRKDTWGFIGKSQDQETSKFYNTYYHICLALGIEYSYLPCPSDTPLVSARYANLDAITLLKEFI